MRKTRKQKEEKRRKKEILQAAAKVFAKFNYHGAKMQDISRASHYPLATIYKYFKSKKEIYYEIFISKACQFKKVLQKAVSEAEEDPLKALKNTIIAKVKFFCKNKHFIKLYIFQNSSIDAMIVGHKTEEIENIYQSIVNIYASLIEKGQDMGLFDKTATSRDLALMLTGMMNSMAVEWLKSCGTKAELQEKFEKVLNVFTGGACVKKNV